MNYAPELTGCGRYTGEIGAYLGDRDYDVEVVTTPPHYPGWRAQGGYKAHDYSIEKGDRVRIYRCPVGLSRNMRGIGRIWAPLSFALSSAFVVMWRILRFRPDQILCVEPTLMAAPPAALVGRLIGSETILHVQDLEIDAAFSVNHMRGGLLKGIAAAYERFVMKRFDKVVTISNRMKDKLLEKGLKPERVSVVRNWVDTSRIYPLKGVNSFREELNIDAEAFVCLYAGNIGVKQALHLVMDAAEQLMDDPSVVFVIAGDGPERAGMVARNLPNVKFLPLQPEARLNELLNFADAHLLPQDKNAADLVLPSKIGGMIASGKLIVAMASPESELHEFLTGVAVFVDSLDVYGLSALIRKVKNDRTIEPNPDRAAILLEQLSIDNITRIFEQ